MTQAKITAAQGFKCAPDGHTVLTIPQGTVVTGQVAEWALAAHMAARMFDPRTNTQAGVDLETKAPAKKRGRPRKKVD